MHQLLEDQLQKTIVLLDVHLYIHHWFLSDKFYWMECFLHYEILNHPKTLCNTFWHMMSSFKTMKPQGVFLPFGSV